MIRFRARGPGTTCALAWLLLVLELPVKQVTRQRVIFTSKEVVADQRGPVGLWDVLVRSATLVRAHTSLPELFCRGRLAYSCLDNWAGKR